MPKDPSRVRPAGKDWQSAGAWHRGRKSGVTHFDFAIFCFMLHRSGVCHLPIDEVARLDRGRHEVVFDDPNDVISKLELEFANGGTEAAKWSKAFATAQRDLKVVMRKSDSYARPAEGKPIHR